MPVYLQAYVPEFVIYRIIGGIGVGLASMLSPMYIAELAPAHIRGKLVSFNQFAIIFGQLLVYCVNYFIARSGDASWLNTDGWRYMFASECIPALLFNAAVYRARKSSLADVTRQARTGGKYPAQNYGQHACNSGSTGN